MSLFSSFVAAVLLTDAASVAYAAITVDGNGGVSHSAGFVDREATAATPLVSSSSSSSSSTASNSHSSSPSVTSWSTATFCGHHSHDRCVAFYAVGFGGLFLVACIACVGWIVRWRWCSSQGLSGWRRTDVMPAARYGDEEESGYVRERVGLLVHADDDSHSDREESTPEIAHGGVADRVARCVRRLNLHGTRLWTFLRMSPAGLFYGASHSTSPPQSPPPAPPPSASAAGSHRRGLLDEADVTSSDGTISHDASWDLQRTDRAASVPSSAGRPFLRGVISVATTTADSSESGNESGRRSDDGNEVLHDGSGHRPFLCDRECLIVEVAENECGVRRSAVVVLPPSSPITPHILPQLVHYNSSSAREEDGDDEDDVGGFADTTDSDSQQMGDAAGAAERAMRLSTSSMTASANSSGHSPLFLRVESTGSVSHGESSEHDGAANSSTSPLRFPHVETAIFDVSMHGGGAVSGAGGAGAAATHIVTVDPSVVNALFEPDHFPQASLHSGSEAPISSAASHVSLVDCCYTPPPMTSGTATPGSARGSGPCKPLSCAAATATVLPVSNSLNDGLDMEGEAVVDDFESAQMSRSYVPATQQQQHHLQQQQQQQQPQRVAVVVVEPPQPEKMHKSSRRTRSDSYYSEPWQPVLVQRPPSQQADAAAATGLPADVVPVFPTVPTRTAEATLRNTVPARPQQPQPQQSPRCPLHTDLCGDLEDELDDLMLEDDASAQSNRTGESGHIFSGSSTSTSRTVTPATETDPESVVGTPTMFCATAMANGGRSCYPGFLTVSPPASASIPLHPESPPVAIFARTVGAGGNFFARDSGMRGGCGNTPPWSSCSVGRGPLHLSLEERTLLMKSRKWLFPLIDGVDEIETSVVGEGEEVGDENREAAAVSEEV